VVYSELLYWLYVQQRDYEGAFVQAKALDRRSGASPERPAAYPIRIMQLASVARSGQAFEQAGLMYGYVSSTFVQSAASLEAAKAQLDMADEQLHAAYPPDPNAARALYNGYQNLLNRLNTNELNLQGRAFELRPELLRKQALILGFTLGKSDSAIALLTQVTSQAARYNPDLASRSKLDLADLYLLDGQPWEATLLYSQVEKDRKEDPLGHQAKLRNGRLSFFKGEFALAQDHLNVLRQATSREIANDAMQLSLMISDNIVFDTLGLALRYYARAELAMLRQRPDKALATLDSIQTLYAGHSLADDVLWRKAQILRQVRKYPEALAALEQIEKAYSQDVYGDDALYLTAQIFEFNLAQRTKAMETYERILTGYPGSIYTAEARKRFRELRGDTVN
jgi:tetratricopeptide (TPR) repeat protein